MFDSKISIIVLTLILFNLTVQECNKGCLKCLNIETCFICDHQNGYFLIN